MIGYIFYVELLNRYNDFIHNWQQTYDLKRNVKNVTLSKDTSVCRLICAAFWRPYLTTNEGEVWSLQRTRNLQDCVCHS